MKEMIKISISDGTPEGSFNFALPQEEVSEIVSLSIQEGVIASQKIEGEDMTGVIPVPISNLPLEALVTNKMY